MLLPLGTPRESDAYAHVGIGAVDKPRGTDQGGHLKLLNLELLGAKRIALQIEQRWV